MSSTGMLLCAIVILSFAILLRFSKAKGWLRVLGGAGLLGLLTGPLRLLRSLLAVLAGFALGKLTGRKGGEHPLNVQSVILTMTQGVQELVTVRKKFQSQINFTDARKLPWLNVKCPGTKRQVMIQYAGEIVCSCDLSQAEIISSDGGIQVTVPHSRIMSFYAIPGSLKCLSLKGIFAGAVHPEDQNRAVNADLASMCEQEIKGGILGEADEQVQKILTSRAGTMGMSAKVIFSGPVQDKISLETQDAPVPIA